LDKEKNSVTINKTQSFPSYKITTALQYKFHQEAKKCKWENPSCVLPCQFCWYLLL